MANSSFLFHTATQQAYMGNIKWASARTTSADGHTTSASTTISAADANFTADDVGATVTGSTLTGGPYTISSVTNATTAVLNTSTGITTATTTALTITPVNDTIKMALFSSAPSLTSPLYADLSSEITGTNYTAGGAALSSLTAVASEANSFSVSRATTTAYSYGQVVRPATGNGFLYQCVVAGTSSGSAWTPANTVVGITETDGTVTWACLGEAITIFGSAAVTWSSATFSAGYGSIYDSSSGANLVQITFSPVLAPTAGPATVTPDATYGWFYLSPQ